MRRFTDAFAFLAFSTLVVSCAYADTANVVEFVESRPSNPILLELRAVGSLGHSLVNGQVDFVSSDGEVASVVDTSTLDEGWQNFVDDYESIRLCVRNDPLVRIEAGRLTSDATWSSNCVHLARNWVVIPSGVTLTIEPGAVVKFCEHAGIWIERGGTLRTIGSADNNVVFAAVADDTFAGDTDLRNATVERNSFEIYKANGGIIDDNGFLVKNDVDIALYPSLKLHDAIVSESSGRLRVPVTVSGTRNAVFSIDYVVADGSAKLGEDYLSNAGTLTWINSTEGTKFIEIPLVRDRLAEPNESLTVSVRNARSVNVSRPASNAVIYDDPISAQGVEFTSAESAALRLELRAEGTVGRALVHGVETRSAPDGSSSSAWDTTEMEDGWRTIFEYDDIATVFVQNQSGVVIEEGRLEDDAVWSSNCVHLVRNWVTIPAGRSLAIDPGTVVKFCEGTGIWVERGGVLNVNGESGHDVVFASAADDEFGGDTDFREGECNFGDFEIVACNGAVLSDTGYVSMPDVGIYGYPTLKIHDTIVSATAAAVRIPITVTGTRHAHFGADWEVVGGTARYGESYSQKSGTIEWFDTTDGTRFIEIPLIANQHSQDGETIEVRLSLARSANIGDDSATVHIYKSNDFPQGAIEVFDATEKAFCKIDTFGVGELIVTEDGLECASSTRWGEGEAPAFEMNEVNPSGETGLVYRTPESFEGNVQWLPSSSPGGYLLKYSSGDLSGDALVAVLDSNLVRFVDCNKLKLASPTADGGGYSITNDEVWTSDKTYVVNGRLEVGATGGLAIQEGTVVKFLNGASLNVATGGICIAKGVVFTHAYDDTVGEGNLGEICGRWPIAGSYELAGDMRKDSSTRFRYLMSSEIGGAVAKNLTLGAWGVYCVTSNLVINPNVTLTIEPGAILKFHPGVSLTISNKAKLEVLGDSLGSVVFTSIKDDNFGGDTNKDRGNSKPAPGDWGTIYVNGGTLEANGCVIRYAGNTGSSLNDVIYMSSGRAEFRNSVIEHSMQYVVGLDGGTWRMANSVVQDCYTVFRHFASSENVNCVFYDCNYLSNNGKQKFVNSIISNFSEGLCWWSDTCEYANCVIWNPVGVGPQSSDKCGKNGNVWANPRFADAKSGDFRIMPNSPCIDAGDGNFAPSLDAYGRPRMDDPDVRDMGVRDNLGACPDVGICESDGVARSAQPDLTVATIAFDGEALVGSSLTLEWNVKNVGEVSAMGECTDIAVFVAENGAQIELGRFDYTLNLAADAEQTHREQVKMPVVPVGKGSLLIVANAGHGIFENNYLNNSRSGESALVASYPAMSIGGGSQNVRLAANASVGYAVAGNESGRFLVVRGEGDYAVRLGNGFAPNADNFTAEAVEVAEGIRLLAIPANSEAYVSFANDSEEIVQLAVELQDGDFHLVDIGTMSAVATNGVSVSFAGAGLSDGMEVYLEHGGTVLRADSVLASSSVFASAVFDLTGAEPGLYSLRVVNGAQEQIQPRVNVAAIEIGPKWECSLDVVSTVRANRIYVGKVRCANSGDAALPSPYVRVTASRGTYVRHSAFDEWSETLEFIAASSTYPASSFKAGEELDLEFQYMTTASSATLTCSSSESDDSEFPWADNGSYMRPSWATDEMWAHAFAKLRGNVGETWNDFFNRMRSDCDYLESIGALTRRMDKLWQMEAREAHGADSAVSTLASSIDLARGGRGFPLALSRSYGSAVSQRFSKGVFGRGWSSAYSTKCELQQGGTRLVVVSSSGITRAFSKVDGEWKSEVASDETILAETADSYEFTCANGTKLNIAKSTMAPAWILDNHGNQLSFVREDGRLKQVVHSDGQFLYFEYNAEGLISAAYDNEGRSVSYEYENGFLVAATSANGLITRYRYHEEGSSPLSGALEQVEDATGNTLDFAYDGCGRLATTARNGSHFMTEIVRGKFGSYSVVAPNGGVSEVVVGADGEVLRTIDALGRVTTHEYDRNGMLSSILSPGGLRSSFAYDADGRVVKSVDARGAATSYSYAEESGGLETLTDARKNTVGFEYDGFGQTIAIKHNHADSSSMMYADNGDVTNAVNAKGESVVCQYDHEGRRILTRWPNGREFTWMYDRRGNCTNASDSVTGSVAMEYDYCDRLVRIVHPNNRGFTYEYDQYGRLVAETTLDGVHKTYGYDGFGRLSCMRDGDGGVLVSNDYDPAIGQLVMQTYGNGTTVSNAYDILGRVISITHRNKSGAILECYEYAYDLEGRRTETKSKTGREWYRFDAASELTGIGYADGAEESFSYDAVGNATLFNGLKCSANELNQYTSFGEYTFEYDGDGNMVAQTDKRGVTTAFYYDCANRLVGVTNETKGVAWSCEYDVFGNRVRVDANGTVTESLYSLAGLGNVAVEYNANCNVLKRNILLGGTIIGETTATGTRYFHGDILGSVRLVSDSAGKAVATADYGAYGAIRRSTGSVPIYGWCGMLGVERDAATGLLFMRARYYSPILGRFITRDPIGLSAGDVNWYRYCGNAPLLFIDPSGLDWRSILCEKLAWAQGFAQGFGEGFVKGVAACADGMNPFGNPFMGYYMNDDGTIDGEYEVSRWCGFGADVAFAGAWLAPGGMVIGGSTSQVVTHWSVTGAQTLKAGEWVMTGAATVRNWIMAGGPQMNWDKAAPYVTSVPKSALSFPKGWEWFKGLLGQRIYTP